MDRYIKENKIIIATIVILVVAFGVIYFGTQSLKTERDLSVQTKCSDDAAKSFASNGYKSSDGYDYQNHFNFKLNKCFILISYYDLNSSSVAIDLYDVLERKHYASYTGYDNCNTEAVKCQLNSGDIWFDGNDTKTPSDYHVGFQGVAVGPGVGDQNTQQQFLDHIQPFMNE